MFLLKPQGQKIEYSCAKKKGKKRKKKLRDGSGLQAL
jgi:hypothetical protein